MTVVHVSFLPIELTLDSIIIAVTSALCSYDDYEELEDLERVKQDFFKRFLELAKGIPDESAFRRMLQCLNQKELQEGLENWLTEVTIRKRGEGAGARLVNRDGGAGLMW